MASIIVYTVGLKITFLEKRRLLVIICTNSNNAYLNFISVKKHKLVFLNLTKRGFIWPWWQRTFARGRLHVSLWDLTCSTVVYLISGLTISMNFSHS